MKMRVMYASKKGKMATYANAIGEHFGCLVNDIPPAYPADEKQAGVTEAQWDSMYKETPKISFDKKRKCNHSQPFHTQ